LPVITRVSHFASTFQTRPSPSGPSAFLFRLMPFPVEDMFPNSHRRTTPSPDAFPNHISPGNQRAAGAIPPPSPCHSTPFSPRGGVPPMGARTKSAVMMCCGTTHAEKYKTSYHWWYQTTGKRRRRRRRWSCVHDPRPPVRGAGLLIFLESRRMST